MVLDATDKVKKRGSFGHSGQWFHELLMRLDIQHQFVISKGAIHNLREELSRLDSNPFEFYAKAFAHAK